MPEVAILSWQMPTKTPPTVSTEVEGAFVHTTELREQGLSVIVSFHAQVSSRERLLATRRWRISELPKSRKGRIEFLLEPVGRNQPVTIMRMRVGRDDGCRDVYIRFEEPAVVQERGRAKTASGATRRHRSAVADRERVFAS